jgi:ArsR family transcriptional regulator, cadmium/lead-responsive transcriptional repressor
MPMMIPIDDVGPAVVDEAGLGASAALFRAFGDPSRLVILAHLQLGPHRVTDLVEHLGLAQSTLSKHLACLRDCGLVRSEPLGRASVFSLVPDVPVLALLAAAEQVLAATGRAVTLCSTAGGERR